MNKRRLTKKDKEEIYEALERMKDKLVSFSTEPMHKILLAECVGICCYLMNVVGEEGRNDRAV